MTRFIEGINPDLFLTEEKLEIGMQIWHVGAGGIAGPSEPYFVGTLLGINQRVNHTNGNIEPLDGRFTFTAGRGYISDRSMLDGHMRPQTYNNWYYCSSKKNAIALYEQMKTIWDNDPSYEGERLSYQDDCQTFEDLMDSYYDDFHDD